SRKKNPDAVVRIPASSSSKKNLSSKDKPKLVEYPAKDGASQGGGGSSQGKARNLKPINLDSVLSAAASAPSEPTSKNSSGKEVEVSAQKQQQEQPLKQAKSLNSLMPPAHTCHATADMDITSVEETNVILLKAAK